MPGLVFIAIGHFYLICILPYGVLAAGHASAGVSICVSEGVHLKACRERRMKSERELEMGNGSDVGSFFLDPKFLF